MENTLRMNAASEYVCARCAQTGETCCRLAQNFSGECFPLSTAELARIRETIPDIKDTVSVNLPNITATIVAVTDNLLTVIAPDAPNTPAFMRAVNSLFPLEKEAVSQAFRPGGDHTRLALPDGRTCVFLSASGCLLPSEARPWFCRIFPFWVMGGKIRHFNSAACLALKENSSIRELLDSFGLTPGAVLNLFDQLRQDWGINHNPVQGA
jgi:Fe-S-cluster containining protein